MSSTVQKGNRVRRRKWFYIVPGQPYTKHVTFPEPVSHRQAKAHIMSIIKDHIEGVEVMRGESR